MIFLLLFFISSSAFAWSGHTHSLLAKESLSDVAQEWGLNEAIPIHTFQQFLEKFSKENRQIKTRDDFAKWLQINPDSRFDKPSREEKGRDKLTPLEILEFYSPRADDWRDVHLPYDKQEQFWFGSGTKAGSQAFRHMEKPAFNMFDPLNTFGFPLGSVGQATKRAQIYFDLAVMAHRLGEPYWAWNFLGVGLHYIEDLSQPYHTAQLLPPLAFKGIAAYFRWGRKEKWGLIKTITHIVANAHHYFEGYTDYFLEHQSFGKMWQKELRGKDRLDRPASIKSLARQVRDFANTEAFETVQTTFQLTGENLLTSYIYDIGNDDRPEPENPIPFLNPIAKERLEAASRVSSIVTRAFQHEGKAIRTVVDAFLRTTKEGS